MTSGKCERKVFVHYFHPVEIKVNKRGKVNINFLLGEKTLTSVQLIESGMIKTNKKESKKIPYQYVYKIWLSLQPIYSTSIFLINVLEREYFEEWVKTQGVILEELQGKNARTTSITNNTNIPGLRFVRRYWSLKHFQKKYGGKDLDFLSYTMPSIITPRGIGIWKIPDIEKRYVRVYPYLPSLKKFIERI